MPKKYSDQEREYIRTELKREALNCMALFGIRKTSVNELVERVSIPKGTFYLFYDSKESLLYEAINEIHIKLQKDMVNAVMQLSGKVSAEKITDIFMALMKKPETTNLLEIITTKDYQMMLLKLPEEVFAEHLESDDDFVELMLKHIPGSPIKNIEVYSAALRGVMITILHRKEIGELVYDEALRIMIHGVIMQIMQ